MPITIYRPRVTISCRKSDLKPKEVNALWESVGWSTYPSQTVRAGINNTTFIILARNKTGELIALIRVMSDDHLMTWIADLAVHPDYQKKGIGSKLLKLVHKRFKHTSIYLDSAWENRKCFKRAGFHPTNLTAYYGGT
jgi:predicted N-acetyltransferase YhbS